MDNKRNLHSDNEPECIYISSKSKQSESRVESKITSKIVVVDENNTKKTVTASANKKLKSKTVYLNKDIICLRDRRLIDISTIHNYVLDILRARRDRDLISVSKELDFWITESTSHSNVIAIKSASKNITEVKSKLKDLKDSVQINEYISESNEYLLFDNIIYPLEDLDLSVTINKDIATKRIRMRNQEDDMFFLSYLDVVKKYVTIDLSKCEGSILCSSCRSYIPEYEKNEEYGSKCPNCLSIIPTFLSLSKQRDDNLFEISDEQEDRANIKASFIRYQCKQSVTLPQDLIQRLDTYFISRGMDKGTDIIENRKLNGYNEREGTNMSIMINALKAIDLSDYYEDYNLICSIYWGWKPYDLSHLEDDFMHRYDLSQMIIRLLSLDRKSSLNTQYRLYRILESLGHPCKAYQFKIIKTPAILSLHESVWKIVCLSLKRYGWKVPEPINIA